jgi:hypothetical protein
LINNTIKAFLFGLTETILKQISDSIYYPQFPWIRLIWDFGIADLNKN